MSFVDPDHIPATGNAAIDIHHRRIARKVNELFDCWKTSCPSADINVRLNDLLDEVADHFAAEKSLVRGAGFPEWDSHEPMHDIMLERMESIRRAIGQEGTHTEGMIDSFRFFEELIFKHEFFDDQDFWESFTRLPPREGEDLVTWGPEHKIGRPSVDVEHEGMVTLLNGIYRALAAGETGEPLCSRVKALWAATRTHFTHEEDAMRAMGHPDLKEHSVLHRVMLRDLEDAAAFCEEGRIAELRELVTSGLKFWFLDHIVSWDKRI